MTAALRPCPLSSCRGSADRRTYVLDTTVLLSDPRALLRFAEHEVVLPVVVISELEAKRHHPELGWFARQTLRLLDDLRISHGRLDAPVPIGDDGGTLRVELNHTDLPSLPAGFRLDNNDTRILAVALNLAAEGRDVTLVTKDMPLRVKAAAVGLAADEYRARAGGRLRLDRHGRARGGRRRRSTCSTTASRTRRDSTAGAPTCPCHTGLVLHSERGSGARPGHAGQAACAWCAATARRSGCTAAAPSSASRWTCCSTPRSASCRWADGPAPASRRSPCAPDSRPSSSGASTASVVVFRPLYAVGGQELGYLPGSESEKMTPWAQAVFDTLGALCRRRT